MKLRDYIELLDGTEVSSLRYEGVVGIRGDEVVYAGEVIDRLTTVAKAKALLDEYVEQEFGSTEALRAMLVEEFG